MELFIAKKENLSQFIESENFFADKNFKNKKRDEEYRLSRFLLKKILNDFYNVKDFEIEYKNNKPSLKESALNFNISHSFEYILIGFCNQPIGVDIEYMKERNFVKLFKRFNLKTSTKEDFYKFFTSYEAKFKLQDTPFYTETFIYKNYMIAYSLKSKDEISFIMAEFTPQGKFHFSRIK